MAAACGLTTVKKFTYRGDSTEEFSNTYWFTGSAPSSSAAWKTLWDQVVLLEKAALPSVVIAIKGYGYDDDTGHRSGDTGTVAPAVWSFDAIATGSGSVPGTLSETGGVQGPGDSAVWLRLKTSRVTSPGGKPIYLRKYFHPAMLTIGTPDSILPAQKTALNALAAALHDGTSFGARTLTAPGHTDTILNHAASSFVTTRTLKRRGKRPGS